MRNLKNIASYINSLSIDLKAEIMISILRIESLEDMDLLIALDGQLKRRYSKDIAKARVDEFEGGDKAITIHLNRDGIYDALPEALFHEFSEESFVSGDDMARDSMKLKAEEKEARSFFLPFENQIFLQLANLAAKENSMFKRMNSRMLHGIVPDFWNINRNIPLEYTDRLVRLIPMAHQIIGHIDLTVQAFEFVLKEKVEIELASSVLRYDNLDEGPTYGGGLGECMLGVDMISGDIAEVYVSCAEVTIGPIRTLDINHYKEGGWLMNLLDCLSGYFLPMELEVRTKIMPAEGLEGFCLPGDDSDDVSFLDFNTTLN
jgi:hypothetical protein